MVRKGTAKARVVIVRPLAGTVKLVHFSGKENILSPRHATIQTGMEAGIGGRIKTGGRRYAGKVIDNVDLTGFHRRFPHCQNLRGETLAALIAGGNLVAVHVPGLERQGTGGILNLEALVEGTVVPAGIDFIVFGRGGGLQGVCRGAPGEHRAAFFQVCAEAMHRKRLHGVRAVVAGTQVLEDAFVHAAGGRKAEGRVQAVAHIGKILVRQELQDHGGHLRDAALAVGAVADVPAAPGRFKAGADIVHQLALHPVCQEAAAQAAFTGG